MAAAVARRAAATIPRHVAAATATATASPARLSPAAVIATRPPSAIAFLRRRVHHTSASPEIDERLSVLEKRVASLEAGAIKEIERVSRIEVDSNSKTARLLVEIDGKMSTLELKLDKSSFNQYRELQIGQNTLHGRCGSLSDQIRALAVASAARDVKADKKHVECLLEVKKDTWKVVCTVLLGASTVAFGVMSIVSSHSKDDNLKAADQLFQKKIAELEKQFNLKLDATVKQAIEVVLAKQALEQSGAGDQPPPGTSGAPDQPPPGTSGTPDQPPPGTSGTPTGGSGGSP